jgi:hypothetical protein
MYQTNGADLFRCIRWSLRYRCWCYYVASLLWLVVPVWCQTKKNNTTPRTSLNDGRCPKHQRNIGCSTRLDGANNKRRSRAKGSAEIGSTKRFQDQHKKIEKWPQTPHPARNGNSEPESGKSVSGGQSDLFVVGCGYVCYGVRTKGTRKFAGSHYYYY